MKNKRLFYIGTILLTIAYLVSSFSVYWQVAKENISHPDCLSCNCYDPQPNKTLIDEPCSDSNNCHNSNHHHHNHPIHDLHKCKICNKSFEQKIAPSNMEFDISSHENPVRLFSITEIIISQFPFIAKSIRGPPIIS